MTTIEQLYQLYLKYPIISTDTRKIAPGSLFFALKGDNFNANTFAGQAINAGAACAVIDDAQYAIDEKYILVDDVLASLQQLAAHHRRQLTIPVIGLTGTNGKTTTKELINSVLSQHFNVLATQGNLNNHIGVPLTLLSINISHQVAVIEMGANHQKEIGQLCSFAQPTHGLITNVGKAHLEGFGGVEGVKKGKGELYDYLASRHPQGVVFVNNDDDTLLKMKNDRNLTNTVYYGTSGHNNLVTGGLTENSPLLTINYINSETQNTYNLKTQLTGAYNLHNFLTAIAIGIHFGLSATEINRGVTGYQPKNNRSQIMKTATNTLICDFYNANPSSMFVAIDNMDKLPASRKVLILGDMFEMGSEAAAEHTAVIEKAMDARVDERIFIGKEFSGLQTEVQHPHLSTATFYLSAENAITGLKAKPVSNATVLIKGSRGMALERLVELF